MAKKRKPAPIEPVGPVTETKIPDGTAEVAFKISTQDGNAVLKECAKAEKGRKKIEAMTPEERKAELRRLEAEVKAIEAQLGLGKKKERNRRKHVCELSCDGSADLIVTDPCYVFRGDDWGEVIDLFHGMATVNGALAPQLLEHGGLKMIIADTIFGDWCCEVEDSLRHGLGTFTADSGCVCALQLPYKDAVSRFKGIARMCWLRIPRFAGTVRICHQNGRCWVEGKGSYKDGLLPGFKSIQIG